MPSNFEWRRLIFFVWVAQGRDRPTLNAPAWANKAEILKRQVDRQHHLFAGMLPVPPGFIPSTTWLPLGHDRLDATNWVHLTDRSAEEWYLALHANDPWIQQLNMEDQYLEAITGIMLGNDVSNNVALLCHCPGCDL